MTAQPDEAGAPKRRHQVVIIGSGFGGLTAAQSLKHADVDIKLIARTTHHLFQPLLYQVATGIISEGEIAPPTRIILRRHRNTQVLLGDVVGINLADKTVKSELLGHTYITPYDSLIVAAGAGQSYFGNDHFAEFAPGMKSIDDALEVRGRILSAFEQAERSSDPKRRERLLTFTVVGAGPTGVEMAGQIAELADHTLQAHSIHRTVPSESLTVRPLRSTSVTIASSWISTPIFSSRAAAFLPSFSPIGGSTCGAASSRITRALVVSMWRNAPLRVWSASSAICPAISTPVGPAPTTVKVSSFSRRLGSLDRSACSNAPRMRPRSSSASSIDFIPGANSAK